MLLLSAFFLFITDEFTLYRGSPKTLLRETMHEPLCPNAYN